MYFFIIVYFYHLKDLIKLMKVKGQRDRIGDGDKGSQIGCKVRIEYEIVLVKNVQNTRIQD